MPRLAQRLADRSPPAHKLLDIYTDGPLQAPAGALGATFPPGLTSRLYLLGRARASKRPCDRASRRRPGPRIGICTRSPNPRQPVMPSRRPSDPPPLPRPPRAAAPAPLARRALGLLLSRAALNAHAGWPRPLRTALLPRPRPALPGAPHCRGPGLLPRLYPICTPGMSHCCARPHRGRRERSLPSHPHPARARLRLTICSRHRRADRLLRACAMHSRRPQPTLTHPRGGQPSNAALAPRRASPPAHAAPSVAKRGATPAPRHAVLPGRVFGRRAPTASSATLLSASAHGACGARALPFRPPQPTSWPPCGPRVLLV
jgi:hypothetical protein